MNRKNKLRYALGIFAGILLIAHLLDIDYENFTWKNLLGPLSMVLLLLSMFLSIEKSDEN